jgi:hypothetical protein
MIAHNAVFLIVDVQYNQSMFGVKYWYRRFNMTI